MTHVLDVIRCEVVVRDGEHLALLYTDETGPAETIWRGNSYAAATRAFARYFERLADERGMKSSYQSTRGSGEGE